MEPKMTVIHNILIKLIPSIAPSVTDLLVGVVFWIFISCFILEITKQLKISLKRDTK